MAGCDICGRKGCCGADLQEDIEKLENHLASEKQTSNDLFKINVILKRTVKNLEERLLYAKHAN